ADLDGVADGGLAGGLADDAPVDTLLSGGQRFDDALRAVDRRPFLVARDQVSDRPLMVRVSAHELLGRGDHRGQPALHICCAAAEGGAVRDRWYEGIGAPFFEGAGRNDVGMPREAKTRTAVSAPGPEVLDVAEAQRLDLETQGREPLDHQLL